jgi:hypothetical protein
MKTRLVFALLLATSTLSACTHSLNHEQVVTTTNQVYPAKNPQHVALYNEADSPNNPYRIIGVARISKFNLLGMKRPDTTVQALMKNMAASIGGDGLMNVTHTDDMVEGNVIAFQRIMI